ncbi:DNA cytosine methyltransferase [Staphylococcus arlettae]|uniref:DNA cytosine methyltransferase n=1 Tax=Staphylococcus arlettae TaxID=29378 RepID=UPI0010727072|nr:DNA cytosine methyltransferase [Staphylococcus arlettae]MBF0737139.1 DNA cytosine methyltransferase [Staphylococcus arlettae]TFU48287.1 DNA cytosine methyltransferase [Staphylococcus arlettae]
MTNSVSSSNYYKNTIAAFFSGVGGIELGFEQTGEFRVVYANEIDKNAQITYNENHLEVKLDKRDIHDVSENDVPDSDIIVGGFPCQAFSIAGYRKGFEDHRGNLFFELLRLINAKKPRAIFVENVKNMVTHDHGNTFKIIREALTMHGYHIKWKVMNGKDFGNVPQNRERIYLVGFKSKEAFDKFDFPSPIKLTKSLKDVIDFSTKVNELYYYRKNKQPFYEQLSSEMIDKNKVYQWRRKYVRENKSGVIPTLTANMGTGGHNVPLILTDDGIRKLTPRETFNAQGFPTSFKLPEGISNGQLYKQAGNSVIVPVIKRIAENISTALKNATDSLFYYESSSKYSIVHTTMNGKFDGESYIVNRFNNKQLLDEFINQNNINFISPEHYLKIIKNNKRIEFYSCES